MHLEHPCWAPEVRDAVNDLLDRFRDSGQYAVTDFDNTTSVFDIEHQLIIWQLRHMAFAMEPDRLAEVLAKDLVCSYSDWIGDIVTAYRHLWDTYGPFNGDMLSEEESERIMQDVWWREFSVKMRAMFSLVNSTERMSSVWILYWFTGMTERQVYDLALSSHLHYSRVPTVSRSEDSPAEIPSALGVVTARWTDGIRVTDSVVELWAALKDNGIGLWVCSASGSMQVKAAIDAFGLHDLCTGLYAMNLLVDEQGRYVPEYDRANGAFHRPVEGGWETYPQTSGAIPRQDGKVQAILDGPFKVHGHGPVAGFMDSTGDFDFCTVFDSMRLVVCYNRLLAPSDGGALISCLALYERDILGYGLASAMEKGDTLCVLQGRDENGLRSLLPQNGTLLLGADGSRVFHEETQDMMAEMKELDSSVRELIDRYGPVDGNGRGFLKEYRGYHSIMD
ncbi:MAG: hypothetical protein MJZ38_05290 [archaeon]|nr:hypothetical protein [archaeon]